MHVRSAKEKVSFDVFTASKRSLGQGNIFIGVCQEFCSQGGCLFSACWDTHIPREQTPQNRPPPEKTTAPEQTPLPEQTPPREQTPPPGRRRPPPEQMPPQSRHPSPAEHAGRYGQRAGGTHPTGMHSCSLLFFVLVLAFTPSA